MYLKFDKLDGIFRLENSEYKNIEIAKLLRYAYPWKIVFLIVS